MEMLFNRLDFLGAIIIMVLLVVGLFMAISWINTQLKKVEENQNIKESDSNN